MDQDQVREARARRRARQQGLSLHKSRIRNPELRAAGYDGYMIVDPRSNVLVAGHFPHEFSMSLDDVEAWLTKND